jgi:hypothetical protein
MKLSAYKEIVAFIANRPTPEQVVAFQPSERVKARVADLVHQEKHSSLTNEETAELDYYLRLEHLMRLIKAHARQPLDTEEYDSYLETLKLLTIPGFYESIGEADAEIETGDTFSLKDVFGEE